VSAAFVLLILLLTLDFPETNCARLVRRAHPTFSFPVSPGEEEIEAEELGELKVKLEIDYQIGEEGESPFRLPLFCLSCPSHPLLPSVGHLTGYQLFHYQGALHMTCFLKMNTIVMTLTNLIVWYVSFLTFFFLCY
jgi:hypothetical protein